MSVLQSIQNALTGIGFPIGEGKYPNPSGVSGKIVFVGGKDADADRLVPFMGGGQADVENFKVVVRGESYRELETRVNQVRGMLKNAGFIQTGGFEDIEPKEGETFMQLAVRFKVISKS